MALLALGVARKALGDLPGAADALRASLQRCENLPLIASWARSRLSSVLLAQGRQDEADAHVAKALRGPGLAQYEARLAQCELAAERGDDDAKYLAAQARQRALAGGHQVSADRLQELIDCIPK